MSKKSPRLSGLSGKDISIIPVPPPITEIIPKTQWTSRAWTYQEHVLSRRILFFTEAEVFFQCSNGIRREAYEASHVQLKLRDDSPQPPDSESVFQQPSTSDLAFDVHPRTSNTLSSVHKYMATSGFLNFTGYSNAVDEYTRRSLTHPGDRINAFSGILKRCLGADEAQYPGSLSGLPFSFFCQALFWTTKKRSVRLRKDHDGLRYLPSWSWAGWTGTVRYEVSPFSDPSSLDITVLDEANIMVVPQQGAKLSKQWSFPIESSPIEHPLTVTLHLFAPVIQFRLKRIIDKARQYELWATPLDGSEEVQFVLFTNPRGGRENTIYEGTIFEEDDHVPHDSYFLLVIKRRDGFAERQFGCHLWPKSGEPWVPSRFIKHEYIKLR